MYVPDEFAAAEPAAMDLMAGWPFGLLISCEAEHPVATHLPFLAVRGAEGRLCLHAHIARANPHWEGMDGRQVLVVFQGPHGYVSPTWYTRAPAVPTWNYAAVHAYGTARVFDEPEALADRVRQLSAAHEAGSAAPWRYDDLPARYRAGMLKHIVGLDIAVERLEGKHKLSQNRPAADRDQVIDALTSGSAGDAELADYMRKQPSRKPAKEAADADT